MSVEHHLLFAVLAFEDELIDLQQLTAACRAWAGDKSKPLADLLVERGWVTAEDQKFLEKKANRKLAKHQNDPRVTLNAVTRGDVCDVLRSEVDDSEVRQSLTTWPAKSPVLLETIGETLIESGRPKAKYTWITEVGAGGLGKVWRAQDNELSREVALKEIKPGSASSDAVRRLIKEAQITGQLQHPGIVPVYEVNLKGRPFYTMKLVRGETLTLAIQEHHKQKQAGQAERLSELRLQNIFLNVCDAIAYAHSRGVIHRDLKPENVVLGEYGEAIVLDWGLARQVDSDDEDSAPIVVTEDARTDATEAGRRLGTPAYMAPEQAAGRVQHMDERTDIYGLGAILFEILTGQPPHLADESVESSNRMTALLHSIANNETPRVQAIDESIPDELDVICATAMAKHRNDRYQTAHEFRAAVLDFQVHEESIELAARAADDLKAAQQGGTYDDFSRARFGFETALQQWSENTDAVVGLNETRYEYAHAAFSRGDLDLALTLLDPADTDQAILLAKIHEEASERSLRTDRIRHLRRFSVGASLTIVVLAFVMIIWSRSEARDERNRAETDKIKAEETAQKEAEARIVAETARKKSDRNVYFNQIGWAHRELKTNSALRAVDLLRQCDEKLRGWEWQYLRQLGERQLFSSHETAVQRVVCKHDRGVWCVRYSPDGKYVATSDGDGNVKVTDVHSGSEVASISPNKLGFFPLKVAIFSVDFHPGNGQWDWNNPVHRQLAIGSFSLQGGKILLWDPKTNEVNAQFHGHKSLITGIAFSPNGELLASVGWGSYDSQGEVKLWDVKTQQEIVQIKGHDSPVRGVAFAPDGKSIATASMDMTVKIWNVANGKLTHTLAGHAGAVFNVAFSPVGNRLGSASTDGTVRLWDTETWETTHTLGGHFGTVNGVAFSPDGKRIASAGWEKTVRVWDVQSGAEAISLPGHEDTAWCVAFSPDGNQLISGSWDKTARIWDAGPAAIAPMHSPVVLDGHNDLVHDIDFSPDGKQLATTGKGTSIQIWDTESATEVLTLDGHDQLVRAIDYSHDGRLLASTSWDRTVMIWNMSNGQQLRSIQNSHIMQDVSFSNDGKFLVSCGADSAISFYEVDKVLAGNTKPLKKFSEPMKSDLFEQRIPTLNSHYPMPISSVSFSSNGKRLVSADLKGHLALWDTSRAVPLHWLKGHDQGVWRAVFSEDGTRVASASWDKTIRIWDTENGKQTFVLKGHEGRVTSLAFSKDGRFLYSGSEDRTVRIWNMLSGIEESSFVNPGVVMSIALSPDGRLLATAGGVTRDGRVTIWKTKDLHSESIQ
jgi:WD40 repeat protein/serine/threonine protein kinase